MYLGGFGTGGNFHDLCVQQEFTRLSVLHKEVELDTFTLGGGAGALLLDLPWVDKAVLFLVVTSCELVIYCANWVEIIKS